ncbi:MAG TPA: aminoacyl--tRNA ligase-related protein [Chthoniobacterales bacterium]|nr:aminoacyl--tRNA ligase-related protein [Chthoniobacterales bacterium]
MPTTAISPRRDEDFPEWYQQVVRAGEMAENSEVRGCMVIKPWGYALWEQMQKVLDGMFKATGHRNAYFPLFIPLSHLQKEAEHVEGFAKECAVVTHHRLEMKDGKLVPAGELTEPLIVRPTSETIIGATYAKWVKSYRDLPILLNQWANVVRWELRPRLFLRTAEFLWQEGHTAHETEAEAVRETEKMLEVYETFARDYLAIPVLRGEKTESERFPGAVRTYCIEAMVQDRKAIQAGTSHFLGQNFAKASGIEFQSREGKLEHAWTTSWGVSTRLIGTLLMAHGDDDGAILPPRIAPSQVVIIPFIPKEENRAAILEKAEEIASSLRSLFYAGEPVRVEIDTRDLGGSSKNWDWIKRGAPLRLEIGPRDLLAGNVVLARRYRGPKNLVSPPTEAAKDFVAPVLEFSGMSNTLRPLRSEAPCPSSASATLKTGSTEKEVLAWDHLSHRIPELLSEIQQSLFDRALAFRNEHTHEINTKEEFYAFFTPKNKAKPEIHGGFALTHWNGSAEVEAKIKEDLKVTIRCIPHETHPVPGTCPFTGEPSAQRVIFGKAY